MVFLNTYYHKKVIVIFIAITFSYLSQAQISELPNQVKGIWETSDIAQAKKYDWKAQWIWLPEKLASHTLLARKNFNLDTLPNEAELRITASSKYELYVNEIYVCQGPARSAPHHQSFDILDITALLKKGINNISVRVHHQQGKVSYHLKGRAGFLAQLDFSSSKKSIYTDKNWKVSKDLSWNDTSPTISRFQNVVNDRVDLRKQIRGWNHIQFNDSSWQNALPLLRNSGWPSQKKNEKASTLTTPWTSLIARDIPYLKESTVKATRLLEAKIIEGKKLPDSIKITNRISGDLQKQLKGYLKKDAPIILKATNTDETWFLLFDFGKVINGMPKVSIEGASGTEVNIYAAPFMVDSIFSHQIVNSSLHDQIVLSGNKDQWQSMYFKPTRYLGVLIKGNPSQVQIHNIGIHQIKYPFNKKGSLSIPEAPWVESLWKASTNTIDVCTTDAFTDNYRERRQYAQTGYYAALGTYFTFGDTALQRRYLIQVAQEQEANGMMPAYAPLAGNDYMVILDSNCLWIRSLYNYLLYSGDYKTVKDLLPTAKKLMTLLDSFTNDLGLINNPPYAYWLDHALNDRRGANFNLNGHYLGALKDFRRLLEFLDDDESGKIKKRATLLKESLQAYFWDQDKQLFADAWIDGKRSTQFSEHANAMALAEHMATENQAKNIIEQLLKKDNHNFIKRTNGMTVVTPAMSYFLHKGIAEYGYEEASLKMLHERFNKMLSSNSNGTLWEEWWLDGTGRSGKFQGQRTRSDAQTESAFAPALFAEYLLGIQVSSPGMTKINIKKPNTTLSEIQSDIPSPLGVLSVHWKMKEKSFLNLIVPKGMTVKIDVKSLNKNNLITINKKSSTQQNLVDDVLELKQGKYEINF